MHNGNLAMLEAMDSTPFVCDAGGVANDLATFSRQCTKLCNILKASQTEHEKAASILRPLCPTRLLCRGSARKHILNNMEEILQALEHYHKQTSGEAASKAHGFIQVVGHGNFILAVKCMLSVIIPLKNLNRSVQSTSHR